jgi:hypothetical protein
MFAKLLGTKSWEFRSTYMSCGRKAKEGVRFYHIKIRGIKK